MSQDQVRQRLRAARKAPATDPWRPPAVGDFQEFRPVLAFDATLSNCGWVLFEVVACGQVMIRDKGTIRPVTAKTGYMGTWAKARSLTYGLDRVMRRALPGTMRVVEAPAVRGSRTESSLIAGMLVWTSGPEEQCAVVSATHVSAVLLGDHKIESARRKKMIRGVICDLVPRAAGRAWNEHERDALATGLTWLHDEKTRRAS